MLCLPAIYMINHLCSDEEGIERVEVGQPDGEERERQINTREEGVRE